MPMPSRAAVTAAHAERVSWTVRPPTPPMHMKTRPKTAWWTCVPPGVTLPGHHLSFARIIRTLKRMNRNAAMKATKKQNSLSLPASTTDCWNQVLIDPAYPQPPVSAGTAVSPPLGKPRRTRPLTSVFPMVPHPLAALDPAYEHATEPRRAARRACATTSAPAAAGIHDGCVLACVRYRGGLHAPQHPGAQETERPKARETLARTGTGLKH